MIQICFIKKLMIQNYMNKYTFSHIITIACCLLFMGVLFNSCKTPKKIVKESPLTKDKTAEELFEKLKQNELKFHFLSASFGAEATINNNTNTFGGNIRIKKDSLIWLSVSKMSIEIIRIKLTQDSLMVLNRINRTYFTGSFKDLNTTFDTDFDYDILQSLILGNDLSFYENNIFKASVDGERYKLSTFGRQKLKKYVKNEDELHKILIQNIWLNPDNYKITANFLKEIKDENRKLATTYSKFNAVGNQLFPYRVSIDLQSESLVSIIVNYSRVRVDETVSFPFSIPSNYKIEKK